MTQRWNASDLEELALPIGRLRERTLLNIGLGRLVHFRAGPWVAICEDGSRLLRVGSPGEPLLFPSLQRRVEASRPAPAHHEAEAPAAPASRAVVFSGPSSRIARGSPGHRSRSRHRGTPRRH